MSATISPQRMSSRASQSSAPNTPSSKRPSSSSKEQIYRTPEDLESPQSPRTPKSSRSSASCKFTPPSQSCQLAHFLGNYSPSHAKFPSTSVNCKAYGSWTKECKGGQDTNSLWELEEPHSFAHHRKKDEVKTFMEESVRFSQCLKDR